MRPNDQSIKILKSISKELDAGHKAKAVRVFTNSYAQNVFPTNSKLPDVLQKSIGKKHTAQLIDSLAQLPCFFCKKGLEPCERCEGQGMIAGNAVCEACIGFGYARCDFCDGTGWATLRAIPEPLRWNVIMRRIKLIDRLLVKSLKRDIPKPSNPNAFQRTSQLLLKFNRILGGLENTITMVDDSSPADIAPKITRTKLKETCIKAAIKCEGAIRDLLRSLSTCVEHLIRTQRLAGSAKEKLLKKAEHYIFLSGQTNVLENSSFEHPFLQKAIDEYKNSRIAP